MEAGAHNDSVSQFVIIGVACSETQRTALPFAIVLKRITTGVRTFEAFVLHDFDTYGPQGMGTIAAFVNDMREVILEGDDSQRARFFVSVSRLDFGNVRTCHTGSCSSGDVNTTIANALVNLPANHIWPGQFRRLSS